MLAKIITVVVALGVAGLCGPAAMAQAQPEAGLGFSPAAPLPPPAGSLAPLNDAPLQTLPQFVEPLPYAQPPPSMVAVPMPEWPRWFAGASGLVMTRTLPSGAAAAALPGAGVVLTTSNASATWPGGVDLRFGRWMGANQEHAIEAIYWGVYGIGSTATVTDNNNRLQAIPQAPGVTAAGTPARLFLHDARSEQISRSDLVNDVEINWVFAPGGRPEFYEEGERRLTLSWLAGFRFFELQDVLNESSLAGSVPAGSTFGVNGGADQMYLNVATNNNIFGGQIGGKADWHILPSLRLSVIKKFMVGGNAITNTSAMGLGNGTAATFAGGSPVNVHTTAGTVSFLGSVDAGLAWDVTTNWTLSMGYRVVGVGNIAQSDQSWPTNVHAPSSLGSINSAGSTFVHGAFAGFEGRF